MKTKILFIVQLPPPVHGAAVINKLIVEQEAIRLSYNVRILPLKFVTDVSKIRRFSVKKLFLMAGFFFRLFFRLMIFRPRLVYFTISPKGNSFYRDALFVSLIKMFGCRHVFHLHSRGIQQGMMKPSARSLYRFVYRNAYVISLSAILNSEFAGLPVKKIFILPNGIPGNKIDLSIRQHDPVRILFLSNLFHAKGILVFLEIIKKLAAKGYSFKAEIAGADGDIMLHEVAQKAVEYGISGYVNLSGPVYGDKKLQAFAAASIFCMPSLDEAFPLVVLEAMQASLCIVASDVGAIPGIIADGKTGFLCRPGNAEDFATKIETLLKDPELRQHMSLAAHTAYRERFTETAFGHNLKKIIDELVTSN